MIRQMSLEDVDVGVDVANQAGPARQQVHGTEAAGAEAVDAISQLVVDVGGGHHGLVAFRSGAVLDAVEDPLTAFAEHSAVAFAGRFAVAFPALPGESSSHSKVSVVWNGEYVFAPLLFQNLRGFSSYFSNCERFTLQITLG